MSGPDYIDDLVATVRASTAQLRRGTGAEAARRPGTGKWSAKEIIGHLIDSAANNHQRFIRIRQQEDLVFTGYDQEVWVTAGAYQDAPWEELLDLWCSYNLQLARVMGAIPEPLRLLPFAKHNLDQLAWQPIPASTPARLEDLMRDYVAHLHHHLRQIEALGLP